jgi:hypothetical protein
MTTDTNASPVSPEAASTGDWPVAMYALRARYRESRDLFSRREMAHLRFVHWLVQTGRLLP